MIPVLYKQTEVNFSTFGIGALVDAVSCTVEEERNGIFELSMQYPVSGMMYQHIALDCIIKAKPNDRANDQLFRIYEITQPMSGLITVNAEHISYELNKIPVAGFSTSGNAQNALNALLNSALIPHNFSALSDITTAANTDIPEPRTVRAILGGSDGSILQKWQGEYEWNNYTIHLHAERGRNTGVVVAYGKNLTDLEQERSIADTITGILPYAVKDEDYIYLPEKIVYSQYANSYARPKVLPVDFSDKFEDDEEITQDALRSLANAYVTNNDIGRPAVNLTISFVPLWQTEEYKSVAALERVSICDIVTVRMDKLGIDVSAKVIRTQYDVLKERYVEMELGDAKSTLADTLTDLSSDIAQIPQKTSSVVKKVVDEQTAMITGCKGGYVVMHLNADNKPYEFLIMDTEDIMTATSVWRWNEKGLAHSSFGYNGPYDDVAITMDGRISAKALYGLVVYGEQIVAGSIASVDGSSVWDLTTGTFSFGNGALKWSAAEGFESVSAKQITTQGSPVTGQIGTSAIGNGFVLKYNGTAFFGVYSSGSGAAIAGGDGVEFIGRYGSTTQIWGGTGTGGNARITLGKDAATINGNGKLNFSWGDSDSPLTQNVYVQTGGGNGVSLVFRDGLLVGIE